MHLGFKELSFRLFQELTEAKWVLRVLKIEAESELKGESEVEEVASQCVPDSRRVRVSTDQSVEVLILNSA